jgi:hypothetical protein
MIDGQYQDNACATSAWRGKDLATMLIAVTVWIADMILSFRGSVFNSFFLVCVAVLTLWLFALIFALTAIDVGSARWIFRLRTPPKVVPAFMLAVALGIGGLWIAQWLSWVAFGRVPQFIVDVGRPTSVVFALDLALVVPFLVLGAMWLWIGWPWGHVCWPGWRTPRVPSTW